MFYLQDKKSTFSSVSGEAADVPASVHFGPTRKT